MPDSPLPEPRLDAGPPPAAEAPRGLDAFFAPRGVAVIGASRTPGKVGHAVVHNLLYGGSAGDRALGFQGPIVPVNPNADQVLGLPCARSVDALSGPIDLAVFALPAREVPAALDAVARRGVRAAIVLSAGFYEMGQEGRRLGAQLRSVAQNTGIRLVGPNCTGIYSARSSLQASFFSVAPQIGPTTLVSQSGAICQALVQYSRHQGIGLRHVVSLGDKVDLSDPELIRYFARDGGTGVLGIYLETIDDPRAFHDALATCAAKKPVVVLRGGTTGPGHRAAKMHEGSVQVRDRALDSALNYPGLYRAGTLSAFLAAIRALATQPPAPGRRVVILTNAGGAGVLAADAVTTAGLDVVNLRPSTLRRLAGIVPNPRAWSNPVDLLGDARADRFVAALEVVSTAEEVDAVLLVITDQAMTDPLDVAVRVCEYARSLKKPIVASFVGQTGQQSQHYVGQFGIPEYMFPELAVEALRALVARGVYLGRLRRRPARPGVTSGATRRAVRPWKKG